MVTTNTATPVGPGTFTRDSHGVTIAEDGKILVRKDDWLSKYSWALYGDYDTLDVFVRPSPAFNSPFDKISGIKEIDDPDRITTGEYLIHEPTYFNWMEKRGTPVKRNWAKPARPVKRGKRVDPSSLRKFLVWLKAMACPVTEWSFKGSDGADLNGFEFFNAHVVSIEAKRERDPESTWYYGAGGGLGLSLAPFSASVSFPGFPSPGFIGKFPMAGASLSADEICGTYLAFEIAAGAVYGVSFTCLLFGIHLPPEILVRKMATLLGGEDLSWRPFPMGMIVMAGATVTSPDFGGTLKVGVLHRRECLPF